MILKRFRAENFRNIERCEIEFSPGVNYVWGDNAQGKTNALEGIYQFARGKSFRAASDGELTRLGQRGFETEITFETKEREQTLTYSFEGGSRKRRRNGIPIRLGEMMGLFRAVLFCPEHLQIVKEGPEKRREFLNIAISQCDPAYSAHYAAYAKILDNRNFLLKTAQKGGYVDMTELAAWSEKMAESAAELYMRRKRYVAGFSPFAEELMAQISSQKEKLELSYEADTAAESREEAIADYRKLLTENLARECAAGCSLWGIHRDDMKLTLGGMPARAFASQGQQRSVVLALKMAEGEYSKALTGEYPVFLFDDVMSELDEQRRAFVMGGSSERQLIITSCDRYEPKKDFSEIRVEGGHYVCSHR